MSSIKVKLVAIGVAIFIAAAAVYVSLPKDGNDDPYTEVDAANRPIMSDYDSSRLITVGVGTLRWTSYYGMEDKVVCVDAGDANSASWNGKAYRSLLNIDETFSNGITGTTPMKESDYTTNGMAVHTHNKFTSTDLENIASWSDGNRPTLMIMSKSVYSELTPEIINGIGTLMSLVVIYEVDSFVDSQMNFSKELSENMRIMGAVFKKTDRTNELKTGIENTIKDIKNLVEGKTPTIQSGYVAGASQIGAKDLTWSVESYLPFDLAGISNVIQGTSTVSKDKGSELLSGKDPDAIFVDLSATTKVKSDASKPVLTKANIDSIDLYFILPYFWFGYNFDNALADAYTIISICYGGSVLDWDACKQKIADVYELFLPNVEDGKGYDCVENMNNNFYLQKGVKKTMDGQPVEPSVFLA